MEINKKNRTELKSYFEAGDIPTANQFSDLIDASLNQKEDGIAKNAGSPLSIQAEGDTQSLQKLINFYGRFEDANPSWSISQNPRTDLNDPSTGKPGFSISVSTGETRLYISKSGGSIGIGTLEPKGKLSIGIDSSDNSTKPFVVYKGDEEDRVLLTLANDGKLGIGTKNPSKKLHVVGETTLQGNTSITGSASMSSNVTVSGKLGVGTTNPTKKLHVIGETSLQGNTNITGIANVSSNMIIGGKLSIGTTASRNRLDVEGAAAIGSSYSGNQTAPGDGLIVQGSVGIGIVRPSKKLDVSGDIRATGKIQIGGTSLSESELKILKKLISGTLQIGGTSLSESQMRTLKKLADGTAYVNLKSAAGYLLDNVGRRANDGDGDRTIQFKSGIEHYWYNTNYAAFRLLIH